MLLLVLGPVPLFSQIPNGFVDVTRVNANIEVEVRYYSASNFVGDTIDGYYAPVIYLSGPAARALSKVQDQLEENGLGLKIFDGYRPQQAVDHFIQWARVRADTLMKPAYYPDVNKSELF